MDIDLEAMNSNTAATLAAGTALGDPKHHAGVADGLPYAVIPSGYEIKELPKLLQPARPIAKVKLRDAASLIQFYKDHAHPQSRIYATIDPPTFIAVIDDFCAANHEATIASQSAWRDYRATLDLPLSREWNTWKGKNNQRMTQLQFAEFLQDNIPDVIKPDGTALLEMALDFEATQSGKFVAGQRLKDGSQNLQWVADNNASNSVELPDMITLSIPVFENSAPSTIEARLRYRIDKNEGKLTLWYELVRPHKVLEAAFRNTWATIAKEASATILLGTPE